MTDGASCDSCSAPMLRHLSLFASTCAGRPVCDACVLPGRLAELDRHRARRRDNLDALDPRAAWLQSWILRFGADHPTRRGTELARWATFVASLAELDPAGWSHYLADTPMHDRDAP